MKKLISFILSAALCMTFLSSTSFAEDIISVSVDGVEGTYVENLYAPYSNGIGTYGTFTTDLGEGSSLTTNSSGFLDIQTSNANANTVSYQMDNIEGREFSSLTGGITALRAPGGYPVDGVVETRYLVSSGANDYFAFGIICIGDNTEQVYAKSVVGGVETAETICNLPANNRSAQIIFSIQGTEVAYSVAYRSGATADTTWKPITDGTFIVSNMEQLNENYVYQVQQYAKSAGSGNKAGRYDILSMELSCMTLPKLIINTDNLIKGYIDDEKLCEFSYGLFDKDSKEPVTELVPDSTITLAGICKNKAEENQDVLLLIGLLNNGVMEQLIPYSLTFETMKWTNFNKSVELLIPSETAGYEVKAFVWTGFPNVQPNFDNIELK